MLEVVTSQVPYAKRQQHRSRLGLSSTKMVIDNIVKLITLEDKGANCALVRLYNFSSFARYAICSFIFLSKLVYTLTQIESAYVYIL